MYICIVNDFLLCNHIRQSKLQVKPVVCTQPKKCALPAHTSKCAETLVSCITRTAADEAVNYSSALVYIYYFMIDADIGGQVC